MDWWRDWRRWRISSKKLSARAGATTSSLRRTWCANPTADWSCVEACPSTTWKIFLECNGGDRFIRLVSKVHSKKIFHVVDGHASTHDQSAVGFAPHVRRRLLVVAPALADNFFDEILH